jgi:hypothetical protein
MNTVKKEEDPSEFGFSHTRLGIERVIEKQKTVLSTPAGQAAKINTDH